MSKTYFVSYLDLEGDLCRVRIEAFDEDDARLQTRREYWNVNEILSIQKCN
jgi:hypothetical protein